LVSSGVTFKTDLNRLIFYKLIYTNKQILLNSYGGAAYGHCLKLRDKLNIFGLSKTSTDLMFKENASRLLMWVKETV
jgi:hypothetical protein